MSLNGRNKAFLTLLDGALNNEIRANSVGSIPNATLLNLDLHPREGQTVASTECVTKAQKVRLEPSKEASLAFLLHLKSTIFEPLEAYFN